ncbi:hypothetical protein [Pseudofulvimonas gallinarii]|uniref:hypothetical protein n=1 Tax=Pseudofulvimonas gallinarii TaxID=634155 RepID=UPI0035E82EA0
MAFPGQVAGTGVQVLPRGYRQRVAGCTDLQGSASRLGVCGVGSAGLELFAVPQATHRRRPTASSQGAGALRTPFPRRSGRDVNAEVV